MGTFCRIEAAKMRAIFWGCGIEFRRGLEDGKIVGFQHNRMTIHFSLSSGINRGLSITFTTY